MSLRYLLSILWIAGACGGKPIEVVHIDAAIDDGAVHDGPVIDGAVPDAAPYDAAIYDAEVPDATPPDAVPLDAAPPDATLPCDPGPFTSGVSTLAGCETGPSVDGIRGIARFANPVNVAIGPDGDLYVADFDSDRVRAVTPTGTARTVVHQAGFQRPFGLAFGATGTLYVSTDDNAEGAHSTQTGTIWRVDTTTGVATPIVEDIGRPRGLAMLADGRLVLADMAHHTIRLLDPDTGVVTPLAGSTDQPGYVDSVRSAARFSTPYGVAQLADGRVAVADFANHRIRAVTLDDGTVTTIAGTGVVGADDGAALSATFSTPTDVAVNAAGVLYIADTGNAVVRRLSAGQVDTVVGSGVPGWLDSDDLRVAQLYGLEGLDVASDGGMMWIADGNHGDGQPFHRVRVVDLVP
jgi:sugar lactone lactonase YvrE